MIGHHLEENGIPTAGISLIRPHTAKIKPPRALWVPFQLGHPMGTPNDAVFQKRVLMALLDLFNRPAGPVLEDFDEDEEESDEVIVLACPVNFSNYADDEEEPEPLRAALNREMMAMRSWYEMSLEKQQRTTFGVSGIELDDLGDFLYGFTGETWPENPRDDLPLSNSLKMAVEDIKSYYIEGITAQPGQERTSSAKLADWFWNETVAGNVIWEIKDTCGKSDDKGMAFTAGRMLVPGDVTRRNQEG